MRGWKEEDGRTEGVDGVEAATVVQHDTKRMNA